MMRTSVRIMNPNLRGVIAESAIAAEAAALGFDVYLPAFGSPRCDMVLDVGGRFVRVQCKHAQHRDGVVKVRARTCRRAAQGYVRGTYTADDVDVIAAYCADLQRCFAVPIKDFGGRGEIH